MSSRGSGERKIPFAFIAAIVGAIGIILAAIIGVVPALISKVAPTPTGTHISFITPIIVMSTSPNLEVTM